MKFKVGDKVKCIEPRRLAGQHLDDNEGKGAGWKLDYVFTIDRITTNLEITQDEDSIAWPKEGNGVYFRALELVPVIDLRKPIL
jgi:hypothetical protein